MAEWNLEELKKEYSLLAEKHGLPDFDEMNKEFRAEKIAESETELVLREVRECITNKLAGYLRFIESIINPANSPMFVLVLTKSLGTKEREKLTDIYKKLVKIEIDLIELDIDYSEKREAEAIKKYYNLWQEIKPELSFVLNVLKKNWDNKEKDSGNAYCG